MVTFKIDKPFTGKYLDNIEAERSKRKIINLKREMQLLFTKGKRICNGNHYSIIKKEESADQFPELQTYQFF